MHLAAITPGPRPAFFPALPDSIPTWRFRPDRQAFEDRCALLSLAREAVRQRRLSRSACDMLDTLRFALSDRTSGQCVASMADIMRARGYRSRSTPKRLALELEDKGFARRQHLAEVDGAQGANAWLFGDPAELRVSLFQTEEGGADFRPQASRHKDSSSREPAEVVLAEIAADPAALPASHAKMEAAAAAQRGLSTSTEAAPPPEMAQEEVSVAAATTRPAHQPARREVRAIYLTEAQKQIARAQQGIVLPLESEARRTPNAKAPGGGGHPRQAPAQPGMHMRPVHPFASPCAPGYGASGGPEAQPPLSRSR